MNNSQLFRLFYLFIWIIIVLILIYIFGNLMFIIEFRIIMSFIILLIGFNNYKNIKKYK